MFMITILYAYRNREVERVKRSLDSLAQQTSLEFNVVFIDYGSKKEISSLIKSVVDSYIFTSYHYLFTEYQPWNKSKALNYGIKKLDTAYCFVADVDMIFHPNFVELLIEKRNPKKVTYFKVGFLSEVESSNALPFESYKVNFNSTIEATGMSLFPVKKLVEVHGFDEFFHFWGGEDTDLHNRLKNCGCEIIYDSNKIMIVHQWHPNYRKRETKALNTELQLTGIVDQNHLHLLVNLKQKRSKVNLDSWGTCMTKNDYELLKNAPLELMDNDKNKINYFLFNELANTKNQVIAIQIKKNQVIHSMKYKIKIFLGKKTATFYNLKAVNDLFLQQIISYHHIKPYFFEISDDLESIIFKIKT